MSTEVIDNPFADAPEAGDCSPVTAEAAREMGFSEEELALLFEAGVLVDEAHAGPWEPTTLQDVAWIIRKRKQLRHEMDERQRWHDEAMARLRRAEEALGRWDELCAQITRDHLPRKKDGTYASKSLPIEGALVKLTAAKGGPKVVDESAVLEFLRSELDLARELNVASPYAPLADAVKVSVTETYEGPAALEVLQDPAYAELAKPKVLHRPVQEFVAALTPEVDPETGEALQPATIPGVELVPATERWSWE